MSSKQRKSIIQRILDRIPPIQSFRSRGKMIISAKIADAMKSKGIDHKELLEKLGKRNNPSQVSRWLSGDHNFTADLLLGIQFVLGVEIFNLELGEQEEVLELKQIQLRELDPVPFRVINTYSSARDSRNYIKQQGSTTTYVIEQVPVEEST